MTKKGNIHLNLVWRSTGLFVIPGLFTNDFLFSLSLQSYRINDQRCSDPVAVRKSTMPSEDFFNLIQHLQSTRIEDQRSPLPVMAS